MHTPQSTRTRPRSTPPRTPVQRASTRTFAVRCLTCGRRFEVDRAPAVCRACGGVAVAG